MEARKSFARHLGTDRILDEYDDLTLERLLKLQDVNGVKMDEILEDPELVKRVLPKLLSEDDYLSSVLEYALIAKEYVQTIINTGRQTNPLNYFQLTEEEYYRAHTEARRMYTKNTGEMEIVDIIEQLEDLLPKYIPQNSYLGAILVSLHRHENGTKLRLGFLTDDQETKYVLQHEFKMIRLEHNLPVLSSRQFTWTEDVQPTTSTLSLQRHHVLSVCDVVPIQDFDNSHYDIMSEMRKNLSHRALNITIDRAVAINTFEEISNLCNPAQYQGNLLGPAA